MPIVIVEMWEGRTLDEKKVLVKGITEAFEKIGNLPDTVHIVLKENSMSNWAKGGRLSSERNSGGK